MRWFRWRLGTLMSIVALAAMAAAAHEMRLRSQAYRRRADYHIAAREQLLRDNKDMLCGYARSQLSAAQLARRQGERDAETRIVEKAAEYHLRLHAKYLRAGERPWLPVDPDPLPPPRANPALASADDY
jgi:hypothetical protein